MFYLFPVLAVAVIAHPACSIAVRAGHRADDSTSTAGPLAVVATRSGLMATAAVRTFVIPVTHADSLDGTDA
jgi:hypothetical protein